MRQDKDQGVPPSGSGCQPSASAADASSQSGIPNAGESTCDVCGRVAVGVASSGYGAVSHAYCRECVQRGAEPLCGFEYLYDFVSRDGEGLADYVQSYVTFRDGRYITWPEYVAERHQGPVCEVHKVHILPRGCDLCGYERWCAEDTASAIEARSDATPQSGAAEGESATRQGDAQTQAPSND